MVDKVDLEFTATEANEAVKRRDLIIVIDVLRCGSTIVNVLVKGAKSIIPTATLREARDLRKQHPDYLLFGERKGLTPKGFDFGNSPVGFSAQDVCRRNIILTTTSGTLAITRCKSAQWVLIGSILNVGSVAEKALEIANNHRINISFILSGDRGQFSLEDFICAGAIAEKFPEEALSDKVSAALLAFEHANDNLLGNIMKAQHAKHLIKMGLTKDVEFSCSLETLKIVPIYKNGKIMSLGQSGGPAGI